MFVTHCGGFARYIPLNLSKSGSMGSLHKSERKHFPPVPPTYQFLEFYFQFSTTYTFWATAHK